MYHHQPCAAQMSTMWNVQMHVPTWRDKMSLTSPFSACPPPHGLCQRSPALFSSADHSVYQSHGGNCRSDGTDWGLLQMSLREGRKQSRDTISPEVALACRSALFGGRGHCCLGSKRSSMSLPQAATHLLLPTPVAEAAQQQCSACPITICRPVTKVFRCWWHLHLQLRPLAEN